MALAVEANPVPVYAPVLPASLDAGIVLLIGGSRSFSRYGRSSLVDLVEMAYQDLHKMYPARIAQVIHGGAEGIDMAADAWAKASYIPVKVYRPDYLALGPRIAPLRRNDDMVAACHVGLFIWDGISNGTAYTINAMKRTHKTHLVVEFVSHGDLASPDKRGSWVPHFNGSKVGGL